MVKRQKEVRTDYRELADVVKQQRDQGYELESAYCNPQNLKEIVCTFSPVSTGAAPTKRESQKDPGKKRSRKKTAGEK